MCFARSGCGYELNSRMSHKSYHLSAPLQEPFPTQFFLVCTGKLASETEGLSVVWPYLKSHPEEELSPPDDSTQRIPFRTLTALLLLEQMLVWLWLLCHSALESCRIPSGNCVKKVPFVCENPFFFFCTALLLSGRI